jgi:hypothetical protein
MVGRIAAEARDAIAAAVEAGATPAELAWELDYPGGHAALDGAHIDRQISKLRAAAATAAETAREDAARQDQLVRWHHDNNAATAEAGLDRTRPDDEWAR